VFFPVFCWMAGALLFIPLGMTVVFAMLASYVLSTPADDGADDAERRPGACGGPSIGARMAAGFERRFGRVQDGFAACSAPACAARALCWSASPCCWARAVPASGVTGTDFFPQDVASSSCTAPPPAPD
jgi:hypothetical protein